MDIAVALGAVVDQSGQRKQPDGTLSGGNTTGEHTASDIFEYDIVDNMITITALKDEEMAGVLVIPAIIECRPVTSIGEGAFSGCAGLASVPIPSSGTSPKPPASPTGPSNAPDVRAYVGLCGGPIFLALVVGTGWGFIEAIILMIIGAIIEDK